jgi:hypothetical protein
LYFEVVVRHSPFSGNTVSPSRPSLGLFELLIDIPTIIVAMIPATNPKPKTNTFFIFQFLLVDYSSVLRTVKLP